ncbi:hypothetical protein DJ568_04380 [Mucilaginibacter hurinus]|uniref:ComEC family competence protein n=1 Tax=Mucilaginibacter hurinus TaxID=2201324 RepID=A0A367GT72_9SPHI|nr:ComEC/Rec2 family competence protein [Mucilaginibacter hurinus]RCH55991.1 hypothetical protein DJ568_04380 [Mucilaginibacter hurinus]
MNIYHRGAIPFVLFLIPYLAGIFAGGSLFEPTKTLAPLYWVLIILTSTFVLLNVFYKSWTYKVKWLGGLIIITTLFISGIINTIQSKDIRLKDHFSQYHGKYLVVKVTNEPAWKNDGLKFTATVEQSINGSARRNTVGNLLITIKDDAARDIYYGDVLLIRAKYYEVDPPLNPAEFNYQKYLFNKNIYHQAYLYPRQHTLLIKAAGNRFVTQALRLRQRLVNKLKANMYHTDAAAVASTLILGYKAELSNDVLQAYSKTGTIHVLSVSGAHVGLVYLVLTFILSFLNRFKHGKVVRAAIIIALVWFYALLTGFSPPVCRAAVMLTLIVGGNTYYRHISSLNILAFSAFIMLLFDPLLIYDVGFQLSYLAVGGLIVLQPLIYNRIKIKDRWLNRLWLVSSASIAAQIITLPLSAYYFHQIPVYFLVSNLFIILPSAIILCGGILYLFLPQGIVIDKWLAYLLEQTILFTNNTLSIIERAPMASINKVWLTKVEYLLLYGIIISCFIVFHKRNRLMTGVAAGLLIWFLASIIVKAYNASKSNEIVFLSLRKEWGIIFKQGTKAVVLTTLSPDNKAYSYSVQPYLDSSNIKSLTVAKISDDIATPFLRKKGNIIRFNEHTIIVLDKNPELKKEIKAAHGLIFVTESVNPEVLAALANKKPTLVLDGSISFNNAIMIEKQAKLLNINYKILKGNKAFIVTSNK